MALQIFVSSVQSEFLEERAALKRQIDNLQDLYVGMEYFGSDPDAAAALDERKLGSSDLYVGVFGEHYGSVDSSTGKSFTELEYDAAIRHKLPCLLYLKRRVVQGRAIDTDAADPRQSAFKRRLSEVHVVTPFVNSSDLELRFLSDMVKVVRGPLLSKAAYQEGNIRFDALHALTRSVLPHQIRAVAQDKYIPEVYIPRAVENDVTAFLEFESRYRERTQFILAQLHAAASAFSLPAVPAIEEVRAAIAQVESSDPLRIAIETLGKTFFVSEVELTRAQLEQIVLKSGAGASLLARKLADQLRGLPYINQVELRDLPRTAHLAAQAMATPGAQLTSLAAYGDLLKLFPSVIERGRVTFPAT